MFRPRVIPVLLLKGEGLVKTEKFRNPKYIGDPRNAVRIFNDKAVDEILLLDIEATKNNKAPNLPLLKEISTEAFVPLGYGGGVHDFETAKTILKMGYEKVCLNSVLSKSYDLVKKVADSFGSQAVVGSVDVRKNFFGKHEVFTHSASMKLAVDPLEHCLNLQKYGVGEIIINSVDLDGTYKGYDLSFLGKITKELSVPVIACGGAGKIEDLGSCVQKGGASAAAAGSLFVFHGVHRAVLINYPSEELLTKLFA